MQSRQLEAQVLGEVLPNDIRLANSASAIDRQKLWFSRLEIAVEQHPFVMPACNGRHAWAVCIHFLSGQIRGFRVRFGRLSNLGASTVARPRQQFKARCLVFRRNS